MNLLIKCLLFFLLTKNIYSQTNIFTNLNELVITDKVEQSDSLVFSKKAIEKAKNIYLPDILRHEPEIHVTRRSISGDIGDMLSIRNLSSNRLLLTLNGRSLNAAGVVGGYYNDFSIIPLDMIEKVQIIKGGSDLKYGNNALGGVINVITKEPKEKLDISFFSSFLTSKEIDYMFNNRLTLSNKVENFGYFISGSHQKNDEYFWNNDFEAKNIGLGVYIDPTSDSKLSLTIQYTNTERGFIRNNRKSNNPTNSLFYQRYNDKYPLAFGDSLNPYGGNVSEPGPGAYWIKEKTLFDLSYKFSIYDWFVEAKYYGNLENRFEYNYSSKIINSSYTNPDGTLVFKRKIESDRSWGGNVDISKEFQKNIINSGFEYKYLGYGDIKIYYIDMSYGCFGITCLGGAASQSADAYAFYFKDEYRLTDNINLNLGIRHDNYKVNRENNSNIKEFNENLFSLSFGMKYKISHNHNIFATVYRKYRTPTMPEVYWWSNNQLGYTKTLKSERNKGFEASYLANLGKNVFEFSTYNYDIDDYIIFRFDPKRGVYNIDNVNIKGLSASYKTEFNSFKPYVNITLQETKKGYDFYDQAKLTEKLDYSPNFKLNAGFDLKLKNNLALSSNYRYSDVSTTLYSWKVGANTYYKLINIKSYDVLDIELKYNYKDLTASLYIENLFNERYEERFGYPLSERLLGCSINFKF
ncbi:MAG: TonB-dependent receptor [Endomicrobia bacterium]|nr:TonB-dependent receptor [Endomicrobiia bacterium]